jgi:hypothetical protein
MLPEASQARKAIWDAINPHSGLRRIDEAFPKEVRDATREQEMFIRFKNGSTWQVLGSDNYDSLVGSPPVGIVASEWALAKPQARAYLRPILRENGGWWMTITTPRGKNHCYKASEALKEDPRAYVNVSTVHDTGMLTPDEIDAERATYVAEYGHSIGDSLFEQEYLCSFDAAIIGAIFSKEVRQAEESGRICKVHHDPKKLVFTSWDLGEGDSTVCWFWQFDGVRRRYIDYYECNREKTAHYIAMLRGRGYDYDTVYLPHDAEHNRMESINTIAGQFKNAGFRVDVIPNTPKKLQIQAGANVIAASEFDSKKCHVGIEALKSYRWNYNKILDETTKTPVHDWASHPADALMCGALGKQEERKHMGPIQYDSRGIV